MYVHAVIATNSKQQNLQMEMAKVVGCHWGQEVEVAQGWTGWQ